MDDPERHQNQSQGFFFRKIYVLVGGCEPVWHLREHGRCRNVRTGFHKRQVGHVPAGDRVLYQDFAYPIG